MPIRHCQKCGLRVLIDESQSTRNPFFCQRCAASEKEEGTKATATAEAPKPSTGPVKVACPFCKASFTGKIPSKPAKGACPVCRKDLVLLPDGSIRPAVGFDIKKWKEEQEMLKYAEDPAQAAEVLTPEPPPPVETEPTPVPEPEPVVRVPSDPTSPETDILDDTEPDGGLDGSLDAALGLGDDDGLGDASPISAPLAPEPTILDADPIDRPLTPVDPLPPVPSAVDPTEDPEDDPLSNVQTMDDSDPEPLMKKPTDPGNADNEETDVRKKPARGKRLADRVKTRRKERDPGSLVPKTGTGTKIFAAFFFLLPLIAAGVGFALKDGALKDPFTQIGEKMNAGLQKVLGVTSDKPEEVVDESKKEEPKKEDPKKEEPKKEEFTAEMKSELEDEMTDIINKRNRKRQFIRQKKVGATEAEMPDIKAAEADLKKLEDRLESLQKSYEKHVGKRFDPETDG